MVTEIKRDPVSWALLTLVTGAAATAALAAIWLGAVSKQVDIDSLVITHMQIVLNDLIRADANQLANQKANERRIDALEAKVDRLKKASNDTYIER